MGVYAFAGRGGVGLRLRLLLGTGRFGGVGCGAGWCGCVGGRDFGGCMRWFCFEGGEEDGEMGRRKGGVFAAS
jgi:hypothetical protein